MAQNVCACVSLFITLLFLDGQLFCNFLRLRMGVMFLQASAFAFMIQFSLDRVKNSAKGLLVGGRSGGGHEYGGGSS